MYALFPVVDVSSLNFQAVRIFGDTFEGAQGILHGDQPMPIAPFTLMLAFSSAR